ncbi:hypothetical protein NNO_0311 [Hydrogenimonas sp.]|nr:hypothetical protein NNO_0311 [Hydrogenimonas sp.]
MVRHITVRNEYLRFVFRKFLTLFQNCFLFRLQCYRYDRHCEKLMISSFMRHSIVAIRCFAIHPAAFSGGIVHIHNSTL